MDFHLTREQEMVRKMYREFAENEVKPLAEELDEEERFPMETVEKMGKLGMMGIYFPKKYGGAGGDVLSYAMCVEEPVSYTHLDVYKRQGVWDDAVGAEVDASVLDLQHGPGASLQSAGGERLKAPAVECVVQGLSLIHI